MKKELGMILAAVALCVGMIFGIEMTACAEDMIEITLKSPRGLNKEISIESSATVGELKAKIALEVDEIAFGGDSPYRLFGADLKYPNSKLDDDTKVLKDIGFASGQTVHIEKSTNWDSAVEPVKVFGLTITGGKGSQEPYGDYTNVDYYWNYYYKTITIRTNKALTISGAGEMNTNIIIKSAGSGKYTNLTISDLQLINDDGACINVQGNSWVKLTVKGSNVLTSTGENAPYTVNKVPALTLTNSGAYLKIMKASTGTLTATTSVAGQPGIGTYDNTSKTWGIEINGGTIIANGGEGGAGIRAGEVCIYGGNITANGGIDTYGSGSTLYPYPLEILGGTVVARSENGKALAKTPNLENYKDYTATASVEMSGTNTVPYDSTKNDTYKYVKIEPRMEQNYHIALPENTVGYFVIAEAGSVSPAKEGSNYSFVVEIAEGYRKNTDFVVKVNGIELPEKDGKYTIININGNQAITVAGVEEIIDAQIPTTEDLPRTGDNSRLALWTLLLGACALMFAMKRCMA